MKKLLVACEAHGRQGRFHVYVGRPAPGSHPLRFQAAWLAESRGARVRPEVLDAMAELHGLAQRSGRPLEDLWTEALQEDGDQSSSRRRRRRLQPMKNKAT